jgi:hypothetical protein
MAVIALTSSVVGSGVAAYGSYQQGKAAKSLNDYNADVTQQAANYNADQILATAEHNAALTLKIADANAAIAENNARTAISDSLAAASGIRYNNRRMLASNRAATAASGVVVGTGSPLIAEVHNVGMLEMRALEAQRIGQVRSAELLHSAALERWQAGESAKTERWQAESEANMTRWGGKQQANLDRMQGKSARRAGNIGAVSTILQGVGNAYAGYKGLS